MVLQVSLLCENSDERRVGDTGPSGLGDVLHGSCRPCDELVRIATLEIHNTCTGQEFQE